MSCSQFLGDLVPLLEAAPLRSGALRLGSQPFWTQTSSNYLILGCLHVHLSHPFGYDLLQGKAGILLVLVASLETMHNKWYIVPPEFVS